MRNAGLDEAQAGIKIAGRNINNLRYTDDTTLFAENKEELRASWWRWKRRVKKLAKLNFQKLRSRYLVTSLPGKWWGDNGNRERLHFWALKSLQLVVTAMKLKDAYSWEKSYEQPRWHIKKQRHYFANKGLSSQGYGFSWVLKNWCFWTVMLEKTLESPLDCKEIKPLNPKGNQFWIFIEYSCAFCHKGGVICISEVIDISSCNLDSSLCFIQSGILHDVLCI